MEGPYRDLGSGFARLTGAEGLRRGPTRILSVEDVLLELLRNARDAGAQNIYVASTLKKRRYRTLLVLDDGVGIPETYKELIFEPGVTSHHLPPEKGSHLPPEPSSLRSGLSLHHIKKRAIDAFVSNTSKPSSIKIILDTNELPESSLQSNSRTSKSNLRATIQKFLLQNTSAPTPIDIKVFFSSPARLLATLLESRIIQPNDGESLPDKVQSLGFVVSERTIQRIKRGEVSPVEEVREYREESVRGEQMERYEAGGRRSHFGGIVLDQEEKLEIAAILARAARKSYLEVGDISFSSRSGKINLNARLYEPEDEYE